MASMDAIHRIKCYRSLAGGMKAVSQLLELAPYSVVFLGSGDGTEQSSCVNGYSDC